MPEPDHTPPRRFQRQMETLGHGLVRLSDACHVLKRQVERGTLKDDALAAWLKDWLPGAPVEIQTINGRIAWNEEAWMVLDILPAYDPKLLMLLHLPALRTFWRTAMRARRWQRLTRKLPRVWPVDSAVLPPGATLHGLGISDWKDLPSAVSPTRDFEVQGQRISELTPAQWNDLLPALRSTQGLVIERPIADASLTVFDAAWGRREDTRWTLIPE